MKFRLALATATCLALPLAAHAQPVTGPYVSLEGGTSLLYPTNYNFDNIDGTGGKTLYRPAYTGIGSLGYGFGNGFRVELSGEYARSTFHKVDDNFGDQERVYGGQNAYGPIVSVLYDIPVGLPVFPYVGVGAGYQWVKYDSDLKNGAGDGVDLAVGGTEGSFAYQVIGGVSYPIAAVPGLSLTAEYRFQQLVSSRNYDASLDGIPVSFFKVGQQSSNTFLAGVRYQIFNPPPPAPAPAPAPMAAPAPAPAKTYLVFFDWDKAKLTPRATEIIAQAASDSKSQSTTTIAVNGYTDTSGTPVYNQGLSVRRAKAVEAQLVADGVPKSDITAQGFGDTNLLVPTGPGVREPQNRRVEIVLQ